MPVKIQYSEEDRNEGRASTLRQLLTELFLVSDVRRTKVTSKNIQHYKHIKGVKPGSIVSAVILRQYKDEGDFERLFTVRLNEYLKLKDSTQTDFIFDELMIIEDYLDNVLKHDFNNKWKAVLRRYIDFLKRKQDPLSASNSKRTSTIDDKWFTDKIKLKGKKKTELINYIKQYYTDAKPQKISMLLLALEKRHTKPTISSNTDHTHKAMASLLGKVGTRPAMTTQKNKIPTDDHLKSQVEVLEKTLLTLFPTS